MTPKEKAEELIKNMEFEIPYIYDPTELQANNIAKQCALIAVDEIIGQWEIIDVYLANGNGELNQNLKYWYTVKQEINGI